MSTPKLFRNQSNASATAAIAATNSLKHSIITSNTGGFQLRNSNASVFEQRQSNVTFFEPRASTTTVTNCFLRNSEGVESNTNSNKVEDSGAPNDSKIRNFHLKASPRVLNWTVPSS